MASARRPHREPGEWEPKDVEEETDDPKQAYARFRPSEPTRYREGWLPDLG